MVFPEARRVIYEKNVLEQVICQLRFPTILKIDTEVPSAFQEVVRHEFPIYRQTSDDVMGGLPDSMTQGLPAEIRELMAWSSRRHQFSSRDKSLTVSLTRDFIALESRQYTCWEDFIEILQSLVDALITVYQPAYVTRIGLRYRNVIDRRALGLEKFSWSELMDDSVLGPLGRVETSTIVQEHGGRSLIRLNEKVDYVRMEYGQVNDSGGDSSNHLFLLDNDFYTDREMQSDVRDIVSRLNCYNRLNGRLFRWCITERLHDAMEPA